MIKTQFPCSVFISSQDKSKRVAKTDIIEIRKSEVEIGAIVCTLTKRIFTGRKVEWAIEFFEAYQSPGRDGTFPVLKKDTSNTYSNTKLFRASLSLSYISAAWRQVRVILIHKTNKKDKSLPKPSRPITL